MTSYLFVLLALWFVYSIVFFSGKYIYTKVLQEDHNTMIYIDGKVVGESSHNIKELERNVKKGVSDGVKALEMYIDLQKKGMVDILKPKTRKINKTKATRNLEPFLDSDASYDIEDEAKNIESLVKKINKENKNDIKISTSYRSNSKKRTKTL